MAAGLLDAQPAQKIVEVEFSRLTAVFTVDESRAHRTSAVGIDRRGVNGHADHRGRRRHRRPAAIIDVYTAHAFKGKPTRLPTGPLTPSIVRSEPALRIRTVPLISKETRQVRRRHSPTLFSQVAVSRFLSHTACLRSSMSEGSETVFLVTAILGYARVSTMVQDLDAQLAALNSAGVESGQVFTDKLSGSANTARPGLAALLNYAREGDIVVVTAIDRMGRSVAEVTRTIADLSERRILLRALREGVDTGTPTGRAVATIMATLAELELELGRERRAVSRVSRRARQLPATKPAKLTLERQEQLRRLAATGEPVHELARAFGISRATAYRYLAKLSNRSEVAL